MRTKWLYFTLFLIWTLTSRVLLSAETTPNLLVATAPVPERGLLAFDGETGEFIAQLGEGSISDFEVSPSGELYANRWGSGIYRVHRPTGEMTSVFPFQTEVGIALGPDGLFYTGAPFGRIYRLDVSTGEAEQVTDPPPGTGLRVEDMVFAADGTLYVNYGSTDIFRVDLATGDFHTFVHDDSHAFRSMAFGNDGNMYVANLLEPDVLVYDGTTGESLGTFVDDDRIQFANALGFGPDGYLYVGDQDDGLVHRYDATDGQYVDTFTSVPSPLLLNVEFYQLVPEPSGHVTCGLGILALAFYRGGRQWRDRCSVGGDLRDPQSRLAPAGQRRR